MSKYPMIKIEDISNNLDSRRIPLNSQQRKLKESNQTYPYVGANNIIGYIDE
jgi:type I restriction enzyme S subunit